MLKNARKETEKLFLNILMFFLLAVLPACSQLSWYQKSEPFFVSAPSRKVTFIPFVTNSFAEQRVILFYCAAIFCLPFIMLFMATKICSLSHSVLIIVLRFLGLCWYLNSFVQVVQGGESFNEAGTSTNGFHSTTSTDSPSPAVEGTFWGTLIYATTILLVGVGIVLASALMARKIAAVRKSGREGNTPARFLSTPDEEDQHARRDQQTDNNDKEDNERSNDHTSDVSESENSETEDPKSNKRSRRKRNEKNDSNNEEQDDAEDSGDSDSGDSNSGSEKDDDDEEEDNDSTESDSDHDESTEAAAEANWGDDNIPHVPIDKITTMRDSSLIIQKHGSRDTKRALEYANGTKYSDKKKFKGKRYQKLTAAGVLALARKDKKIQTLSKKIAATIPTREAKSAAKKAAKDNLLVPLEKDAGKAVFFNL